MQSAEPQAQPALLVVDPSLLGQACVVEHLLKDEVQKRAVAVVHAAPPQMHPRLFTEVPSVFAQTYPVVQMQDREEEHFVLESLLALK